MSKNENKIHERLRLARERAGLSQGQIAKMMNYHRPTISEIEAGRRRVTSEELSAFSKYYGVSVSWLLDDADGPDPIVQLAARELSKLKKHDLDLVLDLLKSLKKAKS